MRLVIWRKGVYTEQKDKFVWSGKMDKEKIKNSIKTVLEFVFNPRLLFCFGIGWIITNGWSYIAFALGTYLDISWLTVVAGAYMAFLWFPFTPEKLITAIIALFLLKRLFPNDEKTLKKLTDMKESYRKKHPKKDKKEK